MFTKLINRIITAVLLPVLMSPVSPVMSIKKAVWKPTEIISLADSGYAEESRELKITAHRGITAIAPENTLPAYQKAVELGYYSAECDIKLTSDEHWVLSHYSYIGWHFWQIGLIKNLDLETLRTYSYKNGRNFWAYDSLKIPTLEEFLDLFIGSETRPQVEIKQKRVYDKLGSVVDIIREKGLEKQAIVISFDIKDLKKLRELSPDLELWYMPSRINEKSISELKDVGGNVWFSCKFANVNAESLKLAEENGIGVSLWGIDSVKTASKAYKMGARNIETDNISN
ncbi:MAG: hypothetical protein K6F09_06255 [Clostridiales bacterium]|nr:hypothetical protein [Clostridiales bacterium]